MLYFHVCVIDFLFCHSLFWLWKWFHSFSFLSNIIKFCSILVGCSLSSVGIKYDTFPNSNNSKDVGLYELRFTGGFLDFWDLLFLLCVGVVASIVVVIDVPVLSYFGYGCLCY